MQAQVNERLEEVREKHRYACRRLAKGNAGQFSPDPPALDYADDVGFLLCILDGLLPPPDEKGLHWHEAARRMLMLANALGIRSECLFNGVRLEAMPGQADAEVLQECGRRLGFITACTDVYVAYGPSPLKEAYPLWRTAVRQARAAEHALNAEMADLGANPGPDDDEDDDDSDDTEHDLGEPVGAGPFGSCTVPGCYEDAVVQHRRGARGPVVRRLCRWHAPRAIAEAEAEPEPVGAGEALSAAWEGPIATTPLADMLAAIDGSDQERRLFGEALMGTLNKTLGTGDAIKGTPSKLKPSGVPHLELPLRMLLPPGHLFILENHPGAVPPVLPAEGMFVMTEPGRATHSKTGERIKRQPNGLWGKDEEPFVRHSITMPPGSAVRVTDRGYDLHFPDTTPPERQADITAMLEKELTPEKVSAAVDGALRGTQTVCRLPRKRCKQCGLSKPSVGRCFAPDRDQADGLSARCLECERKRVYGAQMQVHPGIMPLPMQQSKDTAPSQARPDRTDDDASTARPRGTTAPARRRS